MAANRVNSKSTARMAAATTTVRTAVWLSALALPYAQYYVADPMDGIEHREFWKQVPASIGPVLGRDTKSFVHLGIATAVWMTGTITAGLWVRNHGLHFRDQ